MNINRKCTALNSQWASNNLKINTQKYMKKTRGRIKGISSNRKEVEHQSLVKMGNIPFMVQSMWDPSKKSQKLPSYIKGKTNPLLFWDIKFSL